MIRRTMALTATVLAAGGIAAQAAQATPVLNVWGTSDISDSLLLSKVLVPGFAAYAGNTDSATISYTAVGTGAAIAEAEVAANHVDAIVVHSPSLEAGFVSGGFSLEPLGRPTFYNDYVLAGPKTDPAGVLAAFPNDAVKAFEQVARAGVTGGATFITRDDNSGTNVKEQQIWGQTTAVATPGMPAPGVTQAWNGLTDASRKTPWSGVTPTAGATFPGWYHRNGLTQGASLSAANTCLTATTTNCYTLVDRGTFVAVNPSNMKIVTQNSTAGSTGGLSELTNPFHAYVVATSTQQTDATHFLNYLTSTDLQNSGITYPVGGGRNVSFTADAYPAITATTMPSSVVHGTSFTITATLSYLPPVSQPIASMPVELQSSTDGGATWTNVSSTTTNASGGVTFTPTIGTSNTNYRLDIAQFDDSATKIASRFVHSDNNQLGTTSGFVMST
ncbi:MAG TPA: hypothetical protein VIJ51_00360 [Solirubrobacteraceae bacterium]